MKKLIALILTVIMLLSTVAIVASAEETDAAQPVEINLESLYGATYVGKALGADDAKPVQDGVISDGEYQSKFVVDKSGEKYTGRGSVPTALLEDYTEYVSHDAEWIYVGFDFYNQADNLRGRLYWNLSFITSLDFTYNGGNSANVAFTQNSKGIYEGWKVGLEVAQNPIDDTTGQYIVSTRENSVSFGEAPNMYTPSYDEVNGVIDVYVAVGKTANPLLNGYYSNPGDGVYTSHQVYEFKVSKAWYAAQVGLASAADVRELAWATILQYVNYYGTSYTQIGHFLTEDERACLAALNGVEYTGTNEGTGNGSYPYDNAMLPRAIILDEDPHIWGDGVVTREPTHFLAGVKTYTCSHCEQTKIEWIAALSEHTYSAWNTYNNEYHTRYCECGQRDYADHTWNDGVVTTEPTHLAPGVKTYTCTDCGATKTEATAMLTGHSYGEWWNYSSSQHAKYCACGYTIFAAHSWNDGVVTLEPTHFTTGAKLYTCSDCSATYTETLPKLAEHEYDSWGQHNAEKHSKTCGCGDVVYADHEWDEGVSIADGKFITKGIKIYTCLECGEYAIEVIDESGDPEETTAGETEAASTTNASTTNAATTAVAAAMATPMTDYGCEGTILGGGAAMISIVSMLGVAVTRKRKKDE